MCAPQSHSTRARAAQGLLFSEDANYSLVSTILGDLDGVLAARTLIFPIGSKSKLLFLPLLRNCILWHLYGRCLRVCLSNLTYNQLNSSMSYQVLARKYRPQKFSEVIGQEHVTRTLKHAIEQGRIAHGYIFSGHRGIGKTPVAGILAMCLNCRAADKPMLEPCGVCESCVEIRAGSSVDVIEIDAATTRGIDEM